MLRMIRVCPRCKGNMLLDNDLYGWYEQCLQCSYLRDLGAKVRVKEQSGAGHRVKGRKREPDGSPPLSKE